MNRSYNFETTRLLVGEWHSMTATDDVNFTLPEVVVLLLTPSVTQGLPPSWQGAYSLQRAEKWIVDRDQEATMLLVAERETTLPLGLLIVNDEKWPDIRIGYLLAESTWGKGFATELVGGLVDCGRRLGIRSITGGVARDNAASQRVLEKLGFAQAPDSSSAAERFYRLDLKH